jgi:glucose/arabinose dehydrogenase
MRAATDFPIAAALAALLLAAIPPAAADPIIGNEPQTVPEIFRPEVAEYDTRVWSSGFNTPWSLVFLPDGRALVSERPGRILLLDKDGRRQPRLYAEPTVRARGEGGLMGLALHPKFAVEP